MGEGGGRGHERQGQNFSVLDRHNLLACSAYLKCICTCTCTRSCEHMRAYAHTHVHTLTPHSTPCLNSGVSAHWCVVRGCAVRECLSGNQPTRTHTYTHACARPSPAPPHTQQHTHAHTTKRSPALFSCAVMESVPGHSRLHSRSCVRQTRNWMFGAHPLRIGHHCVCVCVHACVRVCARTCVCLCVFVCKRATG